jgi:hypothetical protein
MSLTSTAGFWSVNATSSAHNNNASDAVAGVIIVPTGAVGVAAGTLAGIIAASLCMSITCLTLVLLRRRKAAKKAKEVQSPPLPSPPPPLVARATSPEEHAAGLGFDDDCHVSVEQMDDEPGFSRMQSAHSRPPSPPMSLVVRYPTRHVRSVRRKYSSRFIDEQDDIVVPPLPPTIVEENEAAAQPPIVFQTLAQHAAPTTEEAPPPVTATSPVRTVDAPPVRTLSRTWSSLLAPLRAAAPPPTAVVPTRPVSKASKVHRKVRPLIAVVDEQEEVEPHEDVVILTTTADQVEPQPSIEKNESTAEQHDLGEAMPTARYEFPQVISDKRTEPLASPLRRAWSNLLSQSLRSVRVAAEPAASAPARYEVPALPIRPPRKVHTRVTASQ